MTTRLALVFPGQGSQSVGMLKDLALKHTIVQKTFAEASAVLGYDLWALVLNGPEAKLNKTYHTQPAMLVAGIAVYRVLQEVMEITPTFIAGHSLGEYTALVAAQALRFQDAVKLVALRGRLMQEAVPEGTGAMAAIVGLDEDQVKDLCVKAHDELAGTDLKSNVVSPANFNAIGQTVIAGHTPAVERVLILATEAGAKIAKMIPVSVPCHCELLKSASIEFADHLMKTPFYEPNCAVINNVDVAVLINPDDIRDSLRRQLYNSVRWVETIQRLSREGVGLIFECGAGRVLAGLNKRIDRKIKTLSIYDNDTLSLAFSEIKESV